jgi:hypothetical protein
LVGYKGSSETDAAAFYCPYIPLMSSGVVLDPSTFEPVVSFMTRYGYIELTNTASSFGNAADYVGEIAVQNLTFQLNSVHANIFTDIINTKGHESALFCLRDGWQLGGKKRKIR